MNLSTWGALLSASQSALSLGMNPVIWKTCRGKRALRATAGTWGSFEGGREAVKKGHSSRPLWLLKTLLPSHLSTLFFDTHIPSDPFTETFLIRDMQR